MTNNESPRARPDDTGQPWPADRDAQDPPDRPVAPDLPGEGRDTDAPDADPLRKSDTIAEATVEPPD